MSFWRSQIYLDSKIFFSKGSWNTFKSHGILGCYEHIDPTKDDYKKIVEISTEEASAPSIVVVKETKLAASRPAL
jgi:hypothetical protein